jgi:Tol biopolymer transport system component
MRSLLLPGSTLIGFVVMTAALHAQGVSRVSLDPTGSDADAPSTNRAISGDGRYVAFASAATNLVSGDGNGFSDVFVRDRQIGTTIRASVSTTGGDADGASTAPTISADGRFVAFASTATNLVAGDGNGFQDIFVRDLQTGTTIRASVDKNGGDSDGDSAAPWIDADGGVIAFSSSATDLVNGDTNKLQDIFVRDLVAGTTVRASVSSNGTQAKNRSVRPSLSGDGMRVAFSSLADNLVAGDSNNKADIFVHDLWTGSTIRASVSDGGVGGNGTSGDPELSGDGNKVVFDSLASNLVSNDTNVRQDVFVRDLVNDTTTRISVDDAGNEGDDDSFEATINFDGSIVAFASDATNLVPGDTNGTTDIFASYLALPAMRRLSLSNLGVESDGACHQPELSSDGYVVSFESDATSLDPNDGNGLTDVYAHATDEAKFTEFGVGLAGAGGFVPHLYGDDGSGFFGATVHIRDGLGFAHGLLWIGLATSDVTIFGGHFYVDLGSFFVPVPILLDGVVAVPGDGSLDIPAGDLTPFAGITCYVQLALIDPAAVKGISLSNALELDLVSR